MALYKNSIQLKGFVGKDAATKSTTNGNSLTVFSLATKSSFKDKQSEEWVSHTEWHRIVCFGKPAEFAKALKKGDYTEVEGELRSSEYDANGENPSRRRSWEVRASLVRKLQRPQHSGPDPVEGDAA